MNVTATSESTHDRMSEHVVAQDVERDVEHEAELIAQQRKIVNRLRRAQGQLTAVVNAVESGADCRDIVIQLAAVSKALDRAGYAIVASAMRTCIADPQDDSMTPDELEKLFLTLA